MLSPAALSSGAPPLVFFFFLFSLLLFSPNLRVVTADGEEDQASFWEKIAKRPRIAAELAARRAGDVGTTNTASGTQSECDLSGTWTGILRPTSINATHLDDAYAITASPARVGTTWTVDCDETVTHKSCGWKVGAGVFLPNGSEGPFPRSVEIEFDGKGPKSKLVGTLNGACDCIEWDNDSAWARQGSLSCGAASKITKVHVVFMNHLDVGYNMAGQNLGRDNGFIAPVLNRYTQTYFPRALNLSAGMRAAGKDRFVYTTHPWLVSLFVDCPRYIKLGYGDHLECPTEEQLAAFRAGVERGDIRWHHAPFNLQSENVGPAELFTDGLSIADELDARFGLKVPAGTKSYNLRDVPGTTRAVVPLLVDASFGAITVGQNPGTPPTNGWGLHKLARWSDPSTGKSIVFFNHAGGYPLDPGTSAADCGGICREDCMMAPGVPEALCFAFRTDNSGPPTSVDMVQSIFSILREEFPSADVVGSSLEAFVEAVLPHKDALETFSNEVGDTWIQGVQSDPLKMAQYREIVRARQACVAAGACDPAEAQIFNSTRLLLSIPEHTWGLPGLNDSKNWLNTDFHAAYDHDTSVPPPPAPAFDYAQQNEGWREHRVFNNYAVDALRGHASGLYERLVKSLQALRPAAAAAPTPSSLRSAGYESLGSLSSSDLNVSCGGRAVSMAIDPTTGALKALNLGGHDWADADHLIGKIEYSTYLQQDYDEMNAVYHGPRGEGCGFSKNGMAANAPSARKLQVSTRIRAAFTRGTDSAAQSDAGCSVVVHLGMDDPAAVVDYGAVASIWVNLSWVPDAKAAVEVDVLMFNKTRTRLPEAAHWSFYPRSPASGTAYNYSLDKLGMRISPFETGVNGNPRQHAVWQGVFFGPDPAGAAGASSGPVLQVESLDAAVVSPIDASSSATPFLKDLDPLSGALTGMGYNLWNNIWGTNYPLYFPYKPEGDQNLRFRFVLRVEG